MSFRRPAVLAALAGCGVLAFLAPAQFAATAGFLLVLDARRRRAPFQVRPASLSHVLGGVAFWCAICGGVVAMDLMLEFAWFAERVGGAAVPFAPVPIPESTPEMLRVFVAGVASTVLLTLALHTLRTSTHEVEERYAFATAGGAPTSTGRSSELGAGAGVQPLQRRSRVGLTPFGIEPHLFATASTVLIWVGALVCCWAVGLRNPMLLSVVGACWASAFACRNAAAGGRGQLTCMTTYAIMSAVPCAANAFGLLVLNEVERERFFVFAAMDQLYFATQLALASALIPLAGFVLVWNVRGVRQWAQLLPPVGWVLTDRQIVIGAGTIGALAILNQHFNTIRFPNALQSLLSLLPTMAIFVLARASSARNVRGAFLLAAALAFTESLRAFLFAYLRSPVAYPYFALAVGTWFGAGRFTKVFRPAMLPAYAAALVYIVNYGVLGATRENSPYGLAKIGYIADYKEELDARDQVVKQTFASRVANFNQLSQIGRIVDEDGFYNGGTLTYLTFAFIPRAFWPEKPRIERGSWFAVRIGQGRASEDGWFNNTINMTQAGELYINFGWTGVWLGLLLYGALLAACWTTAGMSDARNAVGGAWGFYLIFSTLGQFGDLTVLVTLLAMYIIFAGITGLRQALIGSSDLHSSGRRRPGTNLARERERYGCVRHCTNRCVTDANSS